LTLFGGEWESRTRFELETEDIDRVWIKDVNNLLFVDTDGKIETVGGISIMGSPKKEHGTSITITPS